MWRLGGRRRRRRRWRSRPTRLAIFCGCGHFERLLAPGARDRSTCKLGTKLVSGPAGGACDFGAHVLAPRNDCRDHERRYRDRSRDSEALKTGGILPRGGRRVHHFPSVGTRRTLFVPTPLVTPVPKTSDRLVQQMQPVHVSFFEFLRNRFGCVGSLGEKIQHQLFAVDRLERKVARDNDGSFVEFDFGVRDDANLLALFGQ